jgi:histidine triad (HIT) family protein
MTSIFTRIVQGEIPCHRIHEDEEHLAFLDINPVQPGHTLVIPKAEVAYLFDMEAGAYDALWHFVRAVEEKLREATGCARVVLQVVGYEVPHVHVHLIPTNSLSDYPVPKRAEIDHAAAAAFAEKVRALF